MRKWLGMQHNSESLTSSDFGPYGQHTVHHIVIIIITMPATSEFYRIAFPQHSGHE